MRRADGAETAEFSELLSLACATYSALPLRMFTQVHLTRHGPGCWDWAGYVRDNGYGQKWKDGRLTGAHRAAYEYVVGPIPAGLDLDHLCRNHGCINPFHLEPVTRTENNLRGIIGEVNTARAKKQTHCKYGHEFTEQNTRRAQGRRFCRTCASNRYHAKKVRKDGSTD